ncbi:MAG: copper chaperone [Cognaticolwellia sp.]|jgi:copper chaperone
MGTLKFKTTINCGNCVRTVTPFLNELEGIKSWNVDTENPNKILSVETDSLEAEIIVDTVEDLGFEVKLI